MTGKNISSFTSYFNFTHKFEVDTDGTFHKEGSGESVFGEKFSPLPGYLFQLRILNLDTKRFCVYLINRGKEEVKISKFRVKSVYRNIEAEENNFSLLPGGTMPVSDFLFSNFLRTYKECYCHIDIELSEKGKLVLILIKVKSVVGLNVSFYQFYFRIYRLFITRDRCSQSLLEPELFTNSKIFVLSRVSFTPSDTKQLV